MNIFERARDRFRNRNRVTQNTEEVTTVNDTHTGGATIVEPTNEPTKRQKAARIIKILLIGLLVIALLFAFGYWVDGRMNPEARPSSDLTPGLTTTPSTPSSAPRPTPTPSPEACDPQYVQVASNNEEGRVVGDFEARLAEATVEANNLTDAQRTVLIEESGKDASVLAAWAHAFGLYENPNDRDMLVDGNCLSSEGIMLHNQFVGALSATGTTFEEVEAPEDGFNSGITDGVYGVSDAQGVTGDRTAIRVTMRDGTVVYILVRCGNPVYPGKPNLPTVPTDNPPPVTPPVAPPPVGQPPVTPPVTEVWKDAPSNDPGPRQNAPIGGGQNADPGPGPSTPPLEQPPAPPRVNPPAPAPAPPAPAPRPPAPSNPPPAPVPTPDPAPAPPPEPVAPPVTDPIGPTDPGGGCLPPPGETTC